MMTLAETCFSLLLWAALLWGMLAPALWLAADWWFTRRDAAEIRRHCAVMAARARADREAWAAASRARSARIAALRARLQ